MRSGPLAAGRGSLGCSEEVALGNCRTQHGVCQAGPGRSALQAALWARRKLQRVIATIGAIRICVCGLDSAASVAIWRAYDCQRPEASGRTLAGWLDDLNRDFELGLLSTFAFDRAVDDARRSGAKLIALQVMQRPLPDSLHLWLDSEGRALPR